MFRTTSASNIQSSADARERDFAFFQGSRLVHVALAVTISQNHPTAKGRCSDRPGRLMGITHRAVSRPKFVDSRVDLSVKSQVSAADLAVLIASPDRRTSSRRQALKCASRIQRRGCVRR